MSALDLTKLDGRSFALLLLGTGASGEDEWVVFPGVARLQDGTLYIDRRTKPAVEVRAEWIERIRSVDPAARETLQGAEHVLALTVGDVSDDDDMMDTGLRWPK